MQQDLNKTDITKDVTEAAVNWLDCHGFKPVETEVRVADGWIADLAGVIEPTQTELQDLRLIRRKPRWKATNQAERDKWYAEADELQSLMTVIVEVKTSVSDFRGDRKWTLEAPANLAYLAIPADMASVSDELRPRGWGVLEYAGGSIRCTAVPVVKGSTIEQQRDLIHQVAVRRDHSTRYERLRVLAKEQRSHQNEYTNTHRLSQVLNAMLAVTEGQHANAKECLERYGIKSLPFYTLQAVEKLYGIASRRQESPREVK